MVAVVVTDVVGWACLRAKTKLEDDDFVLTWFRNGVEVPDPSGCPDCRIRAQDPPGGTSVPAGSNVSLSVAGPLP